MRRGHGGGGLVLGENKLMKFYLSLDVLQGDSGGPLTYESNGQHILIGETSFGPTPCAQVNVFIAYYILINST